jgi:hypothetical protein
MKHYFPANGTEGYAFDSKWCDHCLADAAFREDNDQEGCPVLAYAQMGEQPVEAWVYEGGEPVCLEFQDNPDNPQRCRFTPDFFAQEAVPSGAVAS